MNEEADQPALSIGEANEKIRHIKRHIGEVLVGQEQVIERPSVRGMCHDQEAGTVMRGAHVRQQRARPIDDVDVALAHSTRIFPRLP